MDDQKGGQIMERTEIGIGNMRIDVVDDNVVYINLNGWTYYIDDSTGEQILEKHKESVFFLNKE
jgi:outer membrane protein assembly factor BamB